MLKKTKNSKTQNGFTLMELLIVMVIIGIMAGLSLFAMQGARMQGRDGRRKSDLETIRSALELYKADCNLYPPNGSISAGGSLTASCPNANTYIESVPGDPNGTSSYIYNRLTNTTYELCATLEDPGAYTSSCTSGGNYKVKNP